MTVTLDGVSYKSVFWQRDSLKINVFIGAFAVFLGLALSAWAYSSPAGSSPDDDYHLASIWCEKSETTMCEPAGHSYERYVSKTFSEIACFAGKKESSANCQLTSIDSINDKVLVNRGNFDSQYPPLFYKTMSFIASDANFYSSIYVMRIVNVLIFIGLMTAGLLLAPKQNLRSFTAVWLITAIPLGLFFIPSTNPSSWTITGVGIGWFALRNCMTQVGWRAWGSGLIYLLCGVLAAGSRPDAGVYIAIITVITLILNFRHRRNSLPTVIFISAAAVACLVFFLLSHQLVASASNGLSEEPSSSRLGGIGLLGYNVVQLPEYFLGMFGLSPIGWMDTELPSIVWAPIVAIIGALFLSAMARGDWFTRAILIMFAVLISVLALYMFQVSGARVGAYVQPRYLFPLVISLLGMLAVHRATSMSFVEGHVQRWIVLVAISISSTVAIFINISRYLQGQSLGFTPNLNSLIVDGNSWWAAPVSPLALVCLAGFSYCALAYLALFRLDPQESRSREI